MIESKFKNTEIGLIPVDWEVKRIEEFTEVVTGATPSTAIAEYWNNGTIPWMNSGEVNLKFVSNVEGRITELGLQNSSTHIIPPHCVLIGLAGQGKTRGTCAYNLISLCTNQSIGSILPNDSFHSLYLYYYMNSKYDDLRLLSAGDGGRGGLNKGILLNFQIPLPPLSEQRRIAEVLSQADELIKQWENVIAKKRDIKTATMQLLLTGKKRLNGFDKPWVEKKLGEVANVKRGIRVISKNLKSQDQFPVYQNCLTPLGFYNHFNTEANTTFVICGGAAGEIGFSKEKFWAADDCFSIITEELDDFYVYNYLILNKFYIKRNVRFASVPRLSPSVIENMPIQLPPLAEQRAIAEILSDMDEEIKTLEQKVSKLKDIKSGMMQQLLSGKIRLVGEDAGNVKQFVENNFGQMPYAAEDEAEFGL